MNNIFYIDSPYLSHYGILGMKWGVRRYQNLDGTLTAAGKRRVKTAMRKRDRMLESTYSQRKYRKNNRKFTKYSRKLYDAETDELIRRLTKDNELRELNAIIDKNIKGKTLADKLANLKSIMDTAKTISEARKIWGEGSNKLVDAKKKKQSLNEINPNASSNPSPKTVPNISSNPSPKKTTNINDAVKKGEAVITSLIGKNIINNSYKMGSEKYGPVGESLCETILRESYASTGDKYVPMIENKKER